MNEGEAAEVSSIQNPGADKWKTKHVFVSSVSKPKQSNAQQSKVLEGLSGSGCCFCSCCCYLLLLLLLLMLLIPVILAVVDVVLLLLLMLSMLFCCCYYYYCYYQ